MGVGVRMLAGWPLAREGREAEGSALTAVWPLAVTPPLQPALFSA